MSGQPEDTFDIAIVGGGLIGASLAIALAPLGYRVAMIEAGAPQAPSSPSFDDRTLALNRASCQILEGIGVWTQLEMDATPIRRIIVTEHGRPGRVDLDPLEMGLPAFGHVVEARRFGAALQERLGGLESCELHCPATLIGLENGADEVRLTIRAADGERCLRARLVVAADGARSAARGMLGIGAVEHDYQQTAVICNITPEQHHRGRAFERFTRTGPFAVLPHTGDRCGLVWSVATPEADRLLAMPDAEFLAGAQERFGLELGHFVRIGRRNAYPLKLVRADRDTQGRVILLGNAAHAIHPVGAQGFNLGCRDVAVLAELLADRIGGDPGAPDLLADYSAWRKPDHSVTIGLSDGMARLFANRSLLASVVRSAGLAVHALSPVMRRRLAIGAMGYRGRIPRLARGQRLLGISR